MMLFRPDNLYEHFARAILAERAAQKERDARVAKEWLENWAHDLSETCDEYITARRSGTFAGRRIREPQAALYASNFRERAEAVYGCAEPIASAIREAGE